MSESKEYHLSKILNEKMFPGNTEAFNQLKEIFKDGKVFGLTGAGTSAPLYPTWLALLQKFISEAELRGILNDSKEAEELRNFVKSDSLEVASRIEEVFGRKVFRAKLAAVFRGTDNSSTETHDVISSMNFKGIITLNYDNGLEQAYVKTKSRYPIVVRATDAGERTRWLQEDIFKTGDLPIMHLHGTTSEAEGMIFTAEDYEEFYRSGDIGDFVKSLWQKDRLLIIGFGFSDPFLIWMAERALRSLPSDTRHFALIGVSEGGACSAFVRRNFSNRFRITPIFYEVRHTGDNLEADHSDLTNILKYLVPIPSKPKDNEGEADVGCESPVSNLPIVMAPNVMVRPEVAKFEFEKHLLTRENALIYVEPRLYRPEQDNKATGEKGHAVNITEIVNGKQSFLISANAEYGATTLCRRLLNEFRKGGKAAFIADAETLPNYRKKLRDEFRLPDGGEPSEAVLIIDKFDLEQHERLIKEIVSLKQFDRYILTTSAKGTMAVGGMIASSLPFAASLLVLSHLEMADIRKVSEIIFDTADDNLTMPAVDKVYRDFTDLCIPLTPANVIMYITILKREGNFQPLNRIQIIDRYIHQLLYKPSDVYQDSFNTKNKIDIISGFVYSLYLEKKSVADETDWLLFCRGYIKKTLVDFDAHSLIRELVSSKIFMIVDRKIVFRYRIFYSYFLGCYVANRISVLNKFLENDAYLGTSDLVEIISGLSTENTTLVEDLTEKLQTEISDFRTKYNLKASDPFDKIKWSDNVLEEEELWRPISEQLNEGPLAPIELDKVKRSLIAERRTEDQTVILQNFDKAERRLTALHSALVSAMRNSDSIDGSIKVKSVKLIFEGYFLIYQIALIHAPIIAKHPVFIWNGIMFLNQWLIDGEREENENKATFRVMMTAAQAIVNTANRSMGTRKLSEVYKEISSGDLPNEFTNYLNYSCNISSKGRSWINVAEKIIKETDRKSFYLFNILNCSIKQFKEEVNTVSDTQNIKRTIALIRAKRDVNKNNPGEKLVSKIIDFIDSKKLLEE